MLRERVADDIYVFSSEIYAQVTAGAVVTSDGAILIDTLAFPGETQQVVRYVQERHGVPIRYVVNTHYHADHTYGTCFVEGARVVSHRLCWELLDTIGRTGLKNAKRNAPELDAIEIKLPDIVFDRGVMNLHLGGVTLRLWHAPGHSPDSVVCLVEEERILFAADTMMPVPFFVDGGWEPYVHTLESLLHEPYECIVQGHGEVILRGEAEERIKEDLHYLYTLRSQVGGILERNKGPEALALIDIEACGKSRIALNGLVEQLHRSNAEALYWSMLAEREGKAPSRPV